jgi:hypothetical protein
MQHVLNLGCVHACRGNLDCDASRSERLGFEAIARRRPLVQNLMSVAEALVRRGAPPFSAELTAGYPRWLSRL